MSKKGKNKKKLNESKKIYAPRRQNYTDQEILTIYQQFDGNRTKAAEYWGIPRKTVNNWFLKIEADPKFIAKLEQAEKNLYTAKPFSTLKITPAHHKTYVVTSEVNDTAIHRQYLKSLLNYCDYKDAQLIVVPLRYKNVNAFTNQKDYKPSWSRELAPYRLDYDLQLNKNIVIMGSYKAQATAVNPINARLGAMAAGKSAVVGHPQISLHMVPTPMKDLPRQLITTGCISQKNYSHSPTGDYADFNHSFGATVIEVVDDSYFNTRVINATDDGVFYDVDIKSRSIAKYSSSGVETGFRVETLACGDLHAYHLDPNVLKATWTDEDSIFNICKPKRQINHDAFDHYSQNHHHKNDWFTKVQKIKENRWLVEDELKHLANFHNNVFNDPDCEYHYVASNHNDALVRWLKETDFRQDPHNAKIYLELSLLCLNNDFQHPLYLWMRDQVLNKDNTFFHTKKDKLEILGVDYAQHGDKGPNGAKGSPVSFVNAGVKTTSGHTHVPMINKGVHVCGTSSLLDMGYNDGYSSWIHCHNLQYPNGKRTPIFIIGDNWIMH